MVALPTNLSLASTAASRGEQDTQTATKGGVNTIYTNNSPLNYGSILAGFDGPTANGGAGSNLTRFLQSSSMGGGFTLDADLPSLTTPILAIGGIALAIWFFRRKGRG